ncbi:peroxynitrite isomerase THAP4-like [Neocloeon triangulifer]|uniref:peroxynitrite isomerase THAP4-like n=1 Tax=Neocloeon triangulifer TaxID=2078957 RepID=UPI00286F8FED|nr:peroxynitrite isomerase THAP4-like [Neocloeon triangulifer]
MKIDIANPHQNFADIPLGLKFLKMSIPQELEGKVGIENENLKPLLWLIGRWKSESGVGTFPTVSPFEYAEEIEFFSLGQQPLLNYAAYSFKPGANVPMHCEKGFLRIKPGTNSISFMVAHNLGLAVLEEGEVAGNEINLESKNIGRMSFAKDPEVTKLKRCFKLEGDVLEQIVHMQTSKTEMSEHLVAKYKKM